MKPDFESVNKAFTRQSVGYDSYDESNPILGWMRNKVRKHILNYLRVADEILELNAGTGLDALYFAEQGCNVHATDLSDGMVKEIKNKISRYVLDDCISAQQCSYTELHKVEKKYFDYIFSNFGGLNCIPDLKEVSKDIPTLLKPGGYVTLVIMPPVCPWEIALLLKGKFRKAFRRFKKKGDLAHLEGEYFNTWYFTPTEVMKAFGADFKKIQLEGLASLSPPPHKNNFPLKYPLLYKRLTKADEYLSGIYPFNRWADHFIITLQYIPGKI